MPARRLIPAILAAGLLIVGCSSNNASTDNDQDNWANTIGCDWIKKEKFTHQGFPYPDQQYFCGVNGEATSVYIFRDENRKAAWMDLVAPDLDKVAPRDKWLLDEEDNWVHTW